jgi:hypothetical protein
MTDIKEVKVEVVQKEEDKNEVFSLDRECDECEQLFDAGQNIIEKELDYVPGYGMILEVGIRCPYCKQFYFAAFINSRLKKKRKHIDRLWDYTEEGANQSALKKYVKAKSDYKVQFDRFNRNMADRFDRTWQGNVK